MKRGLLAVRMGLLLLAGVGDARAQGGGGLDGTKWKQLDINNKALFTWGYFTGIQIFAKFAPGPCQSCASDCLDEAAAKLVPLGSSVPDVIKIIDSVYADAANEPIPVQWVLKLAAQKVKGMSEEEWKAAVLEARDGSSPAPAEAPPAPAPAEPPKK